jgi:hypothetical protein
MFGLDMAEGLVSNALRGTPTMPQLNTVSLGTEQSKAIGANAASVPALESLASGVNQFSIDQLTKSILKLDPAYTSQQSAMSKDIASELTGQIPADVQNAIQRSAAAKSLGTGTEMSGAARDLVARDLGLTSLGLIDKGISSAENWQRTSAAMAQPEMMNFGSMFVTPGQETSLDVEERNTQFQYEWGKNNMKWQASPGYAAAAGLDKEQGQMDQMMMSAGKLAGSALGGMI